MLIYEKLSKLARQNNLQESPNGDVKGGLIAEHIPGGCCILEEMLCQK